MTAQASLCTFGCAAAKIGLVEHMCLSRTAGAMCWPAKVIYAHHAFDTGAELSA